MVEPLRAQRTVIRYFYVLVATVTVGAVLMVATAFVAFSVDSRARDEVDGLHLRSLSTLGEMSSRVSQLRGELGSGARSDTELSPEQRRELMSVTFALEQAADSLTDLTNSSEHSLEVFEGPTARVRERVEMLEEAADRPDVTAERLEERLEALELSLFQLSRLHAIDVETDLDAVAGRERAIALALVIGTLALIGVTAGLVWRLVHLLRRRLREYERAQGALIETERRLEESQRLDALATLVGGVAHDFNNLLMVVNLHAETAQSRLDEQDPTHQSLDQIRRAGELAAELTSQLLAFSRQQSGSPQLTDLNELVCDLEPVLRGLVRADIELDLYQSATVAPVLIDPRQLQQVLMNLVVNAKDAMPNGGRLIIRSGDVEIDRDDDVAPPGRYSRISVRDTGAGMSGDVKARAFEPFFTTKAPGRGTGLGLSMVHGIVNQSGGHLAVDSSPGRGTVFDIYLPHAAPADPVAAVPPMQPPSPTETILLVEDEDRIREPLMDALEAHGYEVIAAGSAEEAIRGWEATRNRVDLVVTDVVMPGMRGPALVDELRRSEPELKAVYMSGYVEDAVLSGVMASGDRFIPKPFRLDDIVELVRLELDRSGPRQPEHAG